ncbi:MAG: PorT family protein [Bacteroidia bacterium]|nr:PorT family protein [Bacteroidia bacterium]
MKQVFFLLFATMAISAHAQTNMLDVGTEGGFNLSTLRGNEVILDRQQTLIGFSGGVFAQYNFKKIFSIRTGAYFERKGARSEFELIDINGNPIGTYRGQSRFDYFTVPLLLRANFGKKINWFVNAGPYAGFLIKQTDYTEAINNIPENTADLTEFFKKNDFGISFGAGIHYPLNDNLTLSFEARNNLGLVNISDLPLIGGGEINTNALNFLFGFHYKLGKRG